jgi:hypothetical protein
MIIQNSLIQEESAHVLNIRHKERVYRREAVISADQDAVQVTLTRQARSMSQGTWARSATATMPTPHTTSRNNSEEVEAALESAPTAKDEIQLEILLRTIEKFTGKRFHFSKVGVTLRQDCGGNSAVNHPVNSGPDQGGPETDPAQSENRVRMIETYSETIHSEQEATAVSISGMVTTADGREIALDLGLGMAREYYSEDAQYSLTIAPLTDPLVINYNGNAADLTETKYDFDLNVDGTTDQISFVAPGSGGFLALDKNGDDIVNDGSELFGTVTGNGFSELSAFDEDGNGWIDEGDTIFADLAVWEKDEDGNDRLVALADTGIGAIYLTAVDSPFRVTDTDNQTLGQVRSTGIYLMENGGAGTVQQVDLAT